jgi:diguanylate cyclase (GGDEF)-like protein/PAS domain S-box-containing protein
MTDSPNRKRPAFFIDLGLSGSPLLLAIATVAGVALIGGLTLWNSRAEAERDALLYVENHAQIVEEHARQTVREVVQAMTVAVGFLDSVALTQDDRRLDAFVARIGTSSPRISRFAIFDSSGQVIAGNGTDMTTDSFFGPDDIAPESGFRISANRSFVFIDMPFGGPAGASGGILRTGIAKTYFENFYRTINIRSGSDVGLAMPGGEVLVRQGDQRGVSPLPSPMIQLDTGLQMHAMKISIDGIERFEAYHRLPDIPVLVFSALDATAVYAPWWSGVRLFAVIFVTFAAILATLGRMIVGTQRRRRWLAAIVEASGEAIFSRHVDGRIASWNKGAERLFGYTAAEIIGQHVSVLWTDDQSADLTQRIDNLNKGNNQYENDTVRRRKDGSTVNVSMTGSPILGNRNRIIGVGITARDISELKEVEKRLHRLAYYDPLVNLPNRALLEEELTRAVQQSVAVGQPLALLYLDVDHFKDVNDSFGHQLGDALLQHVARRIGEVVHRNDIFGRLGGDEFGIIQRNADKRDASHLVDRLIARLGAPFSIDEHDVTAGVSIGTALLDIDEAATLEPIDAARLLLQQADTALYEAKSAGRQRHNLYKAAHGDRVRRKMEVQEALARTVRNGGFQLHFQPQVDLATKSIYGAEALLRWNDPDLGVQNPGEFIPIAEQSGLIVELGAWVIREACRTAVSWPDQSLMVGVNVSALQLRRGGLFDLIRETLDETGLAPHRLELELTESALFRDSKDVTSMLWALRALGVRLAIDDFGTGYSTLSYFKDFPVDKLKIDKSFVDSISPGSRTMSIVRAATAMAEGLDLDLVAEGIETETQRDLLRQVGVTRGQGYLFARAVPSADFVVLCGGNNVVRLSAGSD